MLGRSLELPKQPKRIVSLVPSQSELLFDLGLEDEVVGITKFCVHPEAWFRSKERVGGTKRVDLLKIKALQPDLILANKEENNKAEIHQMEQFAPVYITDVRDLGSAYDMIQGVGHLVNRGEQGRNLVKQIKRQFAALPRPQNQKRVVYLIWKDPYMAAGPDSFIHHMLSAAGFENAILDAGGRYPELTIDQIGELEPDVLFLSSEPFPFKRKHLLEVQDSFPHIPIQEVDGEVFSWYGSRMLRAADYFRGLHKPHVGTYLS